MGEHSLFLQSQQKNLWVTEKQACTVGMKTRFQCKHSKLVQAYPRWCLSELLWVSSSSCTSYGLWSGHKNYFYYVSVWIPLSLPPEFLCNLSKKTEALENQEKKHGPDLPCEPEVIQLDTFIFLWDAHFHAGIFLVTYEPFPKWFRGNQNKPHQKIAQTSANFEV